MHGSGFCWLEYLFGIAYLRCKKSQHTILTCNLDGILSNADDKGYDHYSNLLNNKLQKYIELKKLKNVECRLVGHSMGGLIIEDLAHKFANPMYKSLFSICTPYQGAPLLHCRTQSKKRYIQMSRPSIFPTVDAVDKFHIGSYGDFAVPMQSAYPLDTSRCKTYKCNILGHYSTILNPLVWNFICNHI